MTQLAPGVNADQGEFAFDGINYLPDFRIWGDEVWSDDGHLIEVKPPPVVAAACKGALTLPSDQISGVFWPAFDKQRTPRDWADPITKPIALGRAGRSVTVVGSLNRPQMVGCDAGGIEPYVGQPWICNLDPRQEAAMVAARSERFAT